MADEDPVGSLLPCGGHGGHGKPQAASTEGPRPHSIPSASTASRIVIENENGDGAGLRQAPHGLDPVLRATLYPARRLQDLGGKQQCAPASNPGWKWCSLGRWVAYIEPEFLQYLQGEATRVRAPPCRSCRLGQQRPGRYHETGLWPREQG